MLVKSEWHLGNGGYIIDNNSRRTRHLKCNYTPGIWLTCVQTVSSKHALIMGLVEQVRYPGNSSTKFYGSLMKYSSSRVDCRISTYRGQSLKYLMHNTPNWLRGQELAWNQLTAKTSGPVKKKWVWGVVLLLVMAFLAAFDPISIVFKCSTCTSKSHHKACSANM